jgi:hypothetical protein
MTARFVSRGHIFLPRENRSLQRAPMRAAVRLATFIWSLLESPVRSGFLKPSLGFTWVRRRCKKGDAVLRFTGDSAFDGLGVVFEAKRDAAYTPQRALDELDTARKNRSVSAGVFVMAGSHASEIFPRFARFGSNVLVTWDDQDPATDSYLHAAILLGMSLVTRGKTLGDDSDIAALRDFESRIEAELNRLTKMEKHNDSIRSSSDNIADEIRKSQKALDLLIRKAQSTLRALKVDLFDEGIERNSPIALPNSSLEQAVLALPQAGKTA